MDWLVTSSIVVILIIIGMLLFIFMPKPQVFFEPFIKELSLFEQHHEKLADEIKNAKNNDSIIPIYGNGEIKNHNYPFLYELLRSLPDVSYAGIINLKCKFDQKKQYGFNENVDNTVRIFYCIEHPSSQKSGIWIDGESRFFYEKELICGDMSREHSLFNKHKKNICTIVFIDVKRPFNMHSGRSPNNDIDKDEVLKMFYQKE